MKKLLPIAISSGAIAAMWAISSLNLEINTFAGFLAWSTYFAAGGGKKGFRTALLTNFSGICWGALVVLLTTLLTPYVGSILAIGLSTALGSFMAVMQSKINLLNYIPGTFIGLSAFFASNSNFYSTVIAMLLGAFLGIFSESLGNFLEIDFLKSKKQEV